MIVPLAAVALVADGVPPTAPLAPPAAIVLAEAHPQRSVTGMFVMTVRQAERRPNALYLNSSPDYRAPDDVTFHFTPSAAKRLEQRLGAKPEIALIGKSVTVRGTLRLVPIANTVGGQPHSFNRFQHTVLVRDLDEVRIE